MQTHDIPELTDRYGERVWQSYLENKTSRAMRIYWVYGPDLQFAPAGGRECVSERPLCGAQRPPAFSHLTTAFAY